jgi:hypothetical protein
MNDLELTTLWLGSFRYYLERDPDGSPGFCAALCVYWRRLPAHCQNLIQKELDKAIELDNLGWSESTRNLWGDRHLPLP